MLLDDLSDLLMLGLTPSPSLLERRIRLMQDRSRASVAGLMVGSVAAAGLVLMACAAGPPAPRSAPPTVAGVPASKGHPLDETDIELQKAATRFYGDLPPGAAKQQQFLWFVFQHDWTVERHDIGSDDIVELDDADFERTFGKDRPRSMAWSINASLSKKFPDLGAVGTGSNPKNISNFGGGRVAIGRDTVSVIWARYAN